MSTLFISHSSRDNAVAGQIARRLNERNHTSVFLDVDPEQGIVGGQSWERTLYRKLRACRAVIVVCTDHHLASQWCFAEIALARMEGKHVVALLADPLAPGARLPAILDALQFIDLRSDPAQGYQRLWRALDALDLVGVQSEWNVREAPYLGLNAYDERHAPVFFGRDQEIRAGLELLARGAPGLVMVLGASGSGKSSVARAGIVPRLRLAPERWLVVGPCRPRRDPFAEVAQAFSEAFQRQAPGAVADAGVQAGIQALQALGGSDRGTAAAVPAAELQGSTDERLTRLLEHLEDLQRQPPAGAGRDVQQFLALSLGDLRRICAGPPAAAGDMVAAAAAGRADPAACAAPANGPHPLLDLSDRLRRASGHPDARVLLVIDQFEELLGADRDAPATGQDLAGRFIALLRRDLDAEHSPLMALATMRSDFLGAFQQHAGLRGIDFASLSIGPMDQAGMRRAIEEPARLAAITLGPGLTEQLLHDAETPDALPLLSFTLSVLCRDGGPDALLEMAGYRALGGLHGTIAREADAVLASAGQRGQDDAVRRAFLQLARLTEAGAYARQPARWDHPDIARVHATLQEFERRRLLVTRMEPGEARTIEVVHEALFRSWARLKGWLDAQRGELLLLAQLRRDAQAWQERDRPSDALWHGARLQQAAELMRRSGDAVRGHAARPEWRFVRAGLRRRLWTRGVLAGTTLSVIAGLSVLLWMANRAEDKAQRMALEATAQRIVSDGSDMLAGRRHDGTLQGMLAVLAGHRLAQSLGSPALQQAAYGAMQRAVGDLELLRLAQPDDNRRRGVGFAPDSARLIVVTDDGRAEFDLRSGQRIGPVVPMKLQGCHVGVSWNVVSPQFDRAVCQEGVAGETRFSSPIHMVDARTGAVLGQPLEGHTKIIFTIAFAPDGTRLVSGAADNTLRLWDARDGRPLGVLAGHRGIVVSSAFSPDGARIASGSADGTVRVWDGRTGRPQLAPLAHGEGQSISSVAFGGRLLASGSQDGSVRLWDASTGRAVGEPLRGHAAGVNALAFSPDGSRLVSGDSSGVLILRDGASGAPLGTPMKGHRSEFLKIQFSPDGRRFASMARDGGLLLWDARTGRLPGDPFDGNAGLTSSLAFSPDGRHLASAGRAESTLQLWDTTTGAAAELGRETQASVLNAVAFSPRGDQLATAADDGTVQRWDPRTRLGVGAPLRTHAKAVSAIDYDKAGERLLTAADDGTVRLWLSGSGQPVGAPIKAAAGLINGAAFVGDGSHAVVAAATGMLQLWDTASGNPVSAPFDCRCGKLDAVAVSPDGERLAATGGESVTLLSLRDRSVISGPMRHGEVSRVGVSFSLDGRHFATYSDDGVRLWNGHDGTPIGQMFGHSPPQFRPVAGAFAPDNVRLAVGKGDALRVLPILDAWADSLCAAVPHNLSKRAWNRLVSRDIPYRAQCPGKPIAPD